MLSNEALSRIDPAADSAALGPAALDSEALLEPQVAKILGDILGKEPDAILRQESFLSYGSDSLVLVMLATKISERFGVTLTIFQLFELSTLEELCAYLSERIREMRSAGASGRHPSSDLSWPSQQFPVLATGEHRTRAVISCEQRLFWRLAIQPGLAAYFNLRMAVMLQGPLDIPALRASLQDLVDRHDSLRAHFVAADPSDVEHVEFVVPARTTPTFEIVEPEMGATSDPTAIAQALLQREIEVPFDLFGEPLARFKLIRFGPTQHAFLITVHHLITDEWSLNVLKQELLQLYAAHSHGRAAALPERPLQFADYADWNQRLHQTESYRAQERYWDELFVSLGRFDHAAYPSLRDPAAASSTRYADLPIAAQDVQRIAARGAAYDATPYVLLQSVMHLTLYDMLPGIGHMLTMAPVAERHHPELQHAMGMYLAIVGVVSRITPDMTLKAFISQMRGSVRESLETAEARQFALYDLAKRKADDFPLFVYNYVVLPNDSDWNWEGLQAEPVTPPDDTRPFVTMLELYNGRSPTGMWGALKYDTAQLSAQTVSRFIASYQRILQTILSGNHEVPVARLIGAP